MEIQTDIFSDTVADPDGALTVETFKSGPFRFEIGVDFERLAPLLTRVEDAHRRFSSVPILPNVASALEQEVVVSSVFGTNTIEGGTLSEEETERVLASGGNRSEEKDRRVLNLKAAYGLVERFAAHTISESENLNGVCIVLEEQMLIDLHKMITSDLSHPHNVPGAYRDNLPGQKTFVGDTDHGGVYRPPRVRDDIEKLVKAFVAWINSDRVTEISPLIRAPLAHYYYELIHPFWDGNGRLGRVLEALFLKCAGYKYAPFALSKYYLENLDTYFSKFNEARNATEKGVQYPNTAFVEFFLCGMLAVIDRLHGRVNHLIGYLLYDWQMHELHQHKTINDRQLTILSNLRTRRREEHELQDLQAEPWYKNLYRTLSSKTRDRDLRRLQEHGLVTVSRDKKIRLRIPY